MSKKAAAPNQAEEATWSPPPEDSTPEGHAAVLRHLRDSAARAGSWSAAVSAELQRGKLLRLNEADGGEGSVYQRMSPAERQAWVGETLRQWHRQGLIPADVCQSITTLELERRQAEGLPLPVSAAGADRTTETAPDKNFA
jgi:hypothetical protein